MPRPRRTPTQIAEDELTKTRDKLDQALASRDRHKAALARAKQRVRDLETLVEWQAANPLFNMDAADESES